MYPTLYHAFKDLIGIDLNFLQIANTFGFFVALSFLAANYFMTLELRRKEKEGILIPSIQKITIGAALPPGEYISSAFMGFIAGYKLVPIFIDQTIYNTDVKEFIFSLKGNWYTGIALAGLLVFLKYREDKKQRLDVPEERNLKFHPWQHMGTLTMVAAVAGLLGAKMFHWFEYWEDFVKHPVENIVSPSGLTFFGGLICGGIGVLWYASKKGIGVWHMLDVGGPAMMLAYGTGRFGCHFSGDGDWGIVNTAAKPGWMSFLPDWLWAYNYPNNVAHECDPTGGSMPCNFENTPYLQLPVFPTPLYEALAAISLFLVLWYLRKKIKTPGTLFGIYMMMAGAERFFIEKIRVNSTYTIWGFHPTQAEIIAVALFIGGLIMFLYTRKQPVAPVHAATIENEPAQ